MGGTFIDDIITTGRGAAGAGTVFTTTGALDLAGSNERRGEDGHTSKTSSDI